MLIKNNILRLQIFCVAILLLAFAMSSCNDAPTQVGMDFLRDTISIEIITEQENENIIPDASSYLINTSQLNTGGILVGIADDLKAGALIRFNTFGVPQSIREKIINGIVECKLYLYPEKYAYGDTVANYLDFEIKEVTNYWFHNETTSDEVFNSANLYVGGRDLGGWDGTINRADSMDAIELDFDKELFVEWMEKVYDGEIAEEDIVWGIAILPKPNSTIINRFRALNNFQANANFSVIKVKYYKDEEKTEIDSIEVKSANECTFVETKEDNDSNDLIIQGGVRIHSKIDFDISEIPLFSCIHYAELILTLDETKSHKEIDFSDSIALVQFTDIEKHGEGYGSPRSNIVLGEYDSTSKTIVFKNLLNLPLNNFLRGNQGKGTLVLTFRNLAIEANSLNKYVFHGINAADTSKRPKIKIVYSKP